MFGPAASHSTACRWTHHDAESICPWRPQTGLWTSSKHPPRAKQPLIACLTLGQGHRFMSQTWPKLNLHVMQSDQRCIAIDPNCISSVQEKEKKSSCLRDLDDWAPCTHMYQEMLAYETTAMTLSILGMRATAGRCCSAHVRLISRHCCASQPSWAPGLSPGSG